jgi:hypothetical protein
VQRATCGDGGSKGRATGFMSHSIYVNCAVMASQMLKGKWKGRRAKEKGKE